MYWKHLPDFERFKVTIKAVEEREIEVIASSEDQANQLAWHKWRNDHMNPITIKVEKSDI
jgi:hypothetical protein